MVLDAYSQLESIVVTPPRLPNCTTLSIWSGVVHYVYQIIIAVKCCSRKNSDQTSIQRNVCRPKGCQRTILSNKSPFDETSVDETSVDQISCRPNVCRRNVRRRNICRPNILSTNVCRRNVRRRNICRPNILSSHPEVTHHLRVFTGHWKR